MLVVVINLFELSRCKHRDKLLFRNEFDSCKQTYHAAEDMISYFYITIKCDLPILKQAGLKAVYLT